MKTEAPNKRHVLMKMVADVEYDYGGALGWTCPGDMNQMSLEELRAYYTEVVDSTKEHNMPPRHPKTGEPHCPETGEFLW